MIIQLSPPQGLSLHDVRRSLLASPGWEHDHSSRSTRTYLDTFDWRCFRADGLIEFSDAIDGGALAWFDLTSGEDRLRQRADGEPRTRAELPPGRLRRHAHDILGDRALLHVAVVQVEREVLRRLDDERKTVVRVAFEQSIVETDTGLRDIGWRARVEPVLGYPRSADDAAHVLRVLGLAPSTRDAVLDALEHAGAHPGGYSSKMRLAIPAHATAFDAYIQVLRALLDVVEANLAGTIADTDPEFLHDLRVAVRRARSVLRTAGEVLPTVMIGDLRERLRWLQQITSWARDLDVWVLGFDDLAGSFAPESQSSLEPLRAYLEKERAAEHGRLALALESREAHEALASWRAVVEHAVPTHETLLADELAGRLAARHVHRALRKTLTLGRSIDESSPSESLHELRKKAKQLRYLLECFASVLPDELSGDLVPRLKSLQDVLGEHQDSAVQIRELAQFAHVLEGDAPTDTILVMGELVARLRDRQHELRDEYAERFKRFEAAARPHGKGKR